MARLPTSIARNQEMRHVHVRLQRLAPRAAERVSYGKRTLDRRAIGFCGLFLSLGASIYEPGLAQAVIDSCWS
jgi:hypothetical protein